MTEVILHVGPHKTGTTAIQRFLHRNRDQLLEQGILYRTPGLTMTDHNPLVAGFRGGTPPTEVARAFIADLVGKAGDHRVLISSEELSGGSTDIGAFLACLEGCPVTAIGYLRHPYDLVVSAYNQVVRDPRVRRTTPMNHRPFAYDPSLRNIIGHWLERARMVLCPYDPEQWPERSLTRDFLRTIGVDDGLFAHDGNRENRSLSPALLEAARHLNLSGIEEEARAALLYIMERAKVADVAPVVDDELLRHCVDALRAAMPLYEPYLRPGIDTTFLFAPRAA